MAGHLILQYLKTHSNLLVDDVSRSDDSFTSTYNLDVTNFDVLKSVLKKGGYTVVINCIGVLNHFAESRPDQAVLLNSYFPHFLSNLGSEMGFKLIHISTDCVFSGTKGGYIETDPKDGKGFYAQSKALGEVNNSKDLTIRTSIIGPELKNGIGLFHWFMSQNTEIQGYKRVFWSGVTTIELAKFISAILDSDLTGLIHLTNGERISKFDLLGKLNKKFKQGEVLINPEQNIHIDKSLVNTRGDLHYQVPEYELMIDEMKDWVCKHRHLYKRYL
ncbi:hypothetical protein AWW67_02500 [Roseivirga seohaensis]|uniref:dTDP-4-dehydrorhamnose reductase n=2 Tax=Roseivirga seohaensis TaxID=1914963 RepID=A0A150Y0P9_9BACT|nr:hypothetical protein AWW67_02500 [Roseivirga seohaensis]